MLTWFCHWQRTPPSAFASPHPWPHRLARLRRARRIAHLLRVVWTLVCVAVGLAVGGGPTMLRHWAGALPPPQRALYAPPDTSSTFGPLQPHKVDAP